MKPVQCTLYLIYLKVCLLHSFLPHSWSACSVSCGAGQRTRALRCHVLLPFSQSVVQLPLEECLEAAGPPPPTQEPCFLAPCPGDGGSHEESTSTKSPQFDWEYGGFTQCSATCAGGVIIYLSMRSYPQP